MKLSDEQLKKWGEKAAREMYGKSVGWNALNCGAQQRLINVANDLIEIFEEPIRADQRRKDAEEMLCEPTKDETTRRWANGSCWDEVTHKVVSSALENRRLKYLTPPPKFRKMESVDGLFRIYGPDGHYGLDGHIATTYTEATADLIIDALLKE